jgi:hypothetical protein
MRQLHNGRFLARTYNVLLKDQMYGDMMGRTHSTHAGDAQLVYFWVKNI